ncbi:sporulation inhibitor of replication protein SirA [Ornithinibacillus scapharcae]|uniref:sporulation inhibitor of replication protein SirA n=1 Tax=Ornithinibacillus scapharcae TaxID=1147159 RepID=UPI000225B274|nr:sporulation inhibitor of replication protein SirA [Ornithinibacillus scapharcae]
MKEYRVYWIKEEFARHYYYKSDILYRFIQEFHDKQSRPDLVSQFHFITESFPKDSIRSQLVRQPMNTLKKKSIDNHFEIGNSHNYISLHIAEKQIKFRCETLQDAESLLFPTLRRLHTYLFIVDSDYENFGWISPVKLSSGYNNGQVLYS